MGSGVAAEFDALLTDMRHGHAVDLPFPECSGGGSRVSSSRDVRMREGSDGKLGPLRGSPSKGIPL